MTHSRFPRIPAAPVAALAVVGLLAGCGSMGNMFSYNQAAAKKAETQGVLTERETGSTIWDLFSNKSDPNVNVSVNKYIWRASLEVLNFLPVQSVDPFTGVIITGYGTPPGGGRSYRASVVVNDPALDARSLKLSMQYAGGGAVPAETVRAVEDAILTRARQLRIQDRNL
ncbi:DUF3576 domain-containing protein [Paracoccus sp. p4-l81]|uniref:DUF3576 domain-containing protein n=1 Tax=unclassified Paracoccus (in: a-proteobacteria) TaxID=2688777 RepID=UPI0035B9C71A